MIRTEIETYHNGYLQERHPVTSTSRIIGSIFVPFVNQIKYMSVDALCELVKGALEMVREVHETERTKKAKYYGMKIVMNRDREQLMTYIMNQYLTSEGDGLLSGFGMMEKQADGKTNHMAYMGNPERQTLKDIEN